MCCAADRCVMLGPHRPPWVNSALLRLLILQYVSKISGTAKDGAQEFLENVETNTKQYLKLFAEAADDSLPEPSVPVEDDVYDVLQAQVKVQRWLLAVSLETVS